MSDEGFLISANLLCGAIAATQQRARDGDIFAAGPRHSIWVDLCKGLMDQRLNPAPYTLKARKNSAWPMIDDADLPTHLSKIAKGREPGAETHAAKEAACQQPST